MVIFTGGSWGVGQWEFNTLSGLGIANYFSEHDVTVNLCRSGIGAKEQIDNLKHFLIKYKHDETDVIYWLVHNPLVGLAPEEIYNGCTSLELAITNQLIKQLTVANDMAKEHNILIKLVGASCDLTDEHVKGFDNLMLKVPSWGKLLTQDYPASIFAHQADHLVDLKTALDQHRPDLLDEYYKIGGHAFRKRKCMQKNEEMFSSFHPSSLGHRKLRDYLCSDEANTIN